MHAEISILITSLIKIFNGLDIKLRVLTSQVWVNRN